MNKILIILLIISTQAFSQDATKALKGTRQAQKAAPLPTQKQVQQAQKRISLGNKSNDKYMDKYNYQNYNQTIVCESRRGRRNHCNIDTRYGVNIVRQLSGSSCNYHWGYDNTGIWVDGGCRAEFSVNVGWDQPGADGNLMLCESHNYRENYCPAYLGGRDVFLVRQISNSSCQGNWGYDRNGVWVTNGCRAEFVVEDRYSSQNDIVVCSSRNLRFQGCQADTRGGVEFIRQLSRASCNGNWGYDQQGIWVNNGCRARFRVLPYNNFGHNNGGFQVNVIRCSSRGHRRKFCPADTSGGVKFLKQKSHASCQGNWGYDRQGIWVTNGCRATFQLNVNRRGGYNNGYDNGYGNRRNNGYGNNSRGNNDYGNNNGYNNGYGNNNSNNNGYGNRNNQNNNGYGNQQPQQNNRIICQSRNLSRKNCPIPRGARVKLERQLSNKSCRGNWGYGQSEVWVTNGCRAEFSVR